MAVELFQLGIGINASGATTGAREAVTALQSISAAITPTVRGLNQLKEVQDRVAVESRTLGQSEGGLTKAQRENVAAVEQMAVAQARLDRLRQMSVGEIQEEVAAILRLPKALRDEELAILELVAAQQQLDAQRQNSVTTLFAKANAERRETEQWVQASKQTSAAASTVGTATTNAAHGARIAQNALSALAISAAGIPGPVGRVASSLGTLALGGAATVGIVAGMSAIVAILGRIGEESREAKRRTDELIRSLREAERVRTGQQYRDSYSETYADILAEEERLRRAQAGRHISPDAFVVDRAEIAASEAKLEELRKNLRLIAREEQTRLADEARAFKTALQQRSDAARARHEERMQRLAQVRQAELQVNLARAEATGNARDIEAAQYDLAAHALSEQLRVIGELNRAVQDLEQLDRSRLALAGDQLIALQLNAAAVRRAEESVVSLPHPNYLAQNNNAVQIQVDFEKTTRANAEKEWLALQREMKDRAAAEAKQRFEAALRSTNDAFQGMFAGIWEHGIHGFADFFKAIENLAVQTASSIAGAMAVEALGIDKLLRNLTGPNGKNFWAPGRGFNGPGSFAANIGAGFIGGQFGGSLGASQSSGFNAAAVGGLSGAALGFAAGGPIGAIVGGVTGVVSGLLGQGDRAKEAARRMEEAQKAFDLALQSYIASVSGDQLTQALLGNQAKADELIKQAKDVASEQFRQLSVDDLSDGAAAPIFRDLEEQIAKITGVSKQLEEQLKAEAEARRQTVTEDLQVRALRAQGRDAEADALAMALAHARERLALEQELGAHFDAALQAQLAYVHALEVEAAAKGRAEEAARKAAERAEKQAMLREDLEVRALAASGDTAGAEALRRRIAYEREYAEAVKAGMDETTLAMLRNVQAAEELAIAQGEAAKKAQDLIDAMNAEARAMENLEVRHYRAIGQQDFAEEARMRFEHEEEQRRAIEEGRSDAYMTWLKTVQQEEKDAFTKQRQDAQQKAFEDAVRSAFPADAKFLDDKTSVNLAVGVSESTVNRMVGVLQSQLVYQASLPRIESVLNRMEGILRGIRDGTLDLDAIDQGLAVLSADGDRAAGVPPGNR